VDESFTTLSSSLALPTLEQFAHGLKNREDGVKRHEVEETELGEVYLSSAGPPLKEASFEAK
jgi:hypothetical protein